VQSHSKNEFNANSEGSKDLGVKANPGGGILSRPITSTAALGLLVKMKLTPAFT
jgi:hypothetical protein